MNATEPPDPIRIIQPCSEACACFRPLSDGRWPDFGWCRNPASSFHGSVVRTGRECPRYRTDSSPGVHGTG